MYPDHHLPGWWTGRGSPHLLSSSPEPSPLAFYLLGHMKDDVLRLTLVILNTYFKLSNRDFKQLFIFLKLPGIDKSVSTENQTHKGKGKTVPL